ncbi:MAG: glycoside hydrolase family 3 C-terminal domain-containing protein [Proteobacteria bacterium]|nr:glycoside hydrolase family 3 C-terminal domain-containing protein [Pseudomonadota bacterium]
MTRRKILLLATLACTAVTAASSVAVAAANTPAVHPARWPAAHSPLHLSAADEARLEQLLNTLTLEERVGQMIQADIMSVSADDVVRYHLGSVLAGGNAAPGGNVRTTPARWLELTDHLARAALGAASPAHPPVPILFGIDAVHGHARIPGATVFPQNVGLGAAHDVALIEAIGRATAEEVAVTGIDWTFAPTVAVVRDVRWGRSYESYSEDPALVAAYATAMVQGLQGRPGTAEFLAPGHVVASVKHFLGDGGTLDGRDQFDNRSDERTLARVHGAGYPAAIDAGALTVMASYNAWRGTKMHANAALLTDVLKGRWQFPGFVVGDWNAHEEIPGCTKYDCPAVINAGLDVYMAPDSWKRLYENLLADVREGRVPAARLEDAVRRVLRVKLLAGTFGRPAPRDRPEAGRYERLGSPEHRALARRAVRESLVLLKNGGGLLPLEPKRRVLVAGAGADDIGMQSGGWTIDWQGDHNSNADFPGGTSVYAAVRAAVEAAGGHAQLSPDGSYTERPDVAIIVFGETPYAEFQGDRETLELADGRPLALLRRLRAAGIPTVGVLISGRPLWINRELNAATALVAAWQPGTEAGGIADLLFRAPPGAPAYDFTGRLAFSWPATAMPATFDAAGRVHGALYPRGYGLRLGQRATFKPLPEDARVPPAHRSDGSLFRAGHVTAPWSIYVSDATAEVRLTTADQPSPEGAVRARLVADGAEASWSGRAAGAFRIGGRPSDLRARAMQGLAVVLEVRVDARPTATVGIGTWCEAPYGTLPDPPGATPVAWRLCGTARGALLDYTAALGAARPDTWTELVVPLTCLAQRGATLSDVSAPLLIETSGQLALRIREARLEERPGAACPQAAH